MILVEVDNGDLVYTAYDRTKSGVAARTELMRLKSPDTGVVPNVTLPQGITATTGVATATAAGVSILDTGAVYTANNVEAALAEVKLLADAAVGLQKRTVTIGEASLTGTTAQTVNVGAALPANAIILGHEVQIATAFAGFTGATGLVLDIGGTDIEAIVKDFALVTASSPTAAGRYSPRTGAQAQGSFASQQLVATLTPAGGNMTGFTAGSVVLTVWFTILA